MEGYVGWIPFVWFCFAIYLFVFDLLWGLFILYKFYFIDWMYLLLLNNYCIAFIIFILLFIYLLFISLFNLYYSDYSNFLILIIMIIIITFIIIIITIILLLAAIILHFPSRRLWLRERAFQWALKPWNFERHSVLLVTWGQANLSLFKVAAFF